MLSAGWASGSKRSSVGPVDFHSVDSVRQFVGGVKLAIAIVVVVVVGLNWRESVRGQLMRQTGGQTEFRWAQKVACRQ